MVSATATRSRWTAFAAILLMATATLGAVAVMEVDDSDAASTVTIESGQSKYFTWSELGISYTDLTEHEDWLFSCQIPTVYLGSSNTSTYYKACIEKSDVSSDGVTLTCSDGAMPGTYVMTWYAVEIEDYLDVGTTNVRITNDHTGWSPSDPLHSLNWFWNVPQNVGSFTTTLYIERGATVNINTGSYGYAPTISLTDGAGLTCTVNSNNRNIVSGSITSDATFKLVYGAYTWQVNLKVVDKVVPINVPDQSVAAGGSVSISTGVPGITVTGQDWLHVSSDGRIYGTAPSTPGTYKATAHSGSQSDEFAITVVSALTFVSTPSAGIFAYEG